MAHQRTLNRIRFGGAPVGNLYRALTDSDADAVLNHACAVGIEAFDTAPLYGYGLSESRLGRLLASTKRPLRLSTKVGRSLRPSNAPRSSADPFIDTPPFTAVFDYSADAVRRQFDESCNRLGVGTVETVLLHDVGELTHGRDHEAVMAVVLADTMPALADLRAQGRVKRVGVGVNEIAAADALVALGAVDTILVAGRYTLLDQSARGLFDRCHARGIRVLAAGVLQSGLLAGGSTVDYRPADKSVIARRDRMAEIAGNYGTTLASLAIGFALANPSIDEVVIGLGSISEIDVVVACLEEVIDPSVWVALQRAGLLNHDATVPC